jgi:hypothetical protein
MMITSAGALRRQKLAELTSTTGALIVGLGIGIYVARAFAGLAVWFVVAGVLSHGWGMYDRHKQTLADGAAPPWWWRALYGICWIVLAVVLFIAALRAT